MIYALVALICVILIAVIFFQIPFPAPSESPLPEGPFANKTLEHSFSTGYTHIGADGNRLIPGNGLLPGLVPKEIKLDGKPLWLVGVPFGNDTIWAAVLSDGSVSGYRVGSDNVEPVNITPRTLFPGKPPMLLLENGTPIILTMHDESDYSHPIFLNNSKKTVFINKEGDLIITGGNETRTIEINALPDARILHDENERIMLLTGPTDIYQHGVLGDSVEASGITMVKITPVPEVVLNISLQGKNVIEGISPIWSDMTGDGIAEIIVTVSDNENGSRIVVYNENGSQIAASPSIGKGYRWMHQLAVSPIGPDQELELVSVLTPHIGGVLEFYRYTGTELVKTAELKGYSSHEIGSRNLDMAVSGDFDGDGQLEILVPDQSRTNLRGIHRTQGSAEVEWTIPLNGELTTNIGVVSNPQGKISLGVGTVNNVLLIWN